MAYLGSTQASSVANPPLQLIATLGAGPDVRITGGSTLLFTANNFNQSSTATVRPGLGSGEGFWSYTTTDMTSSPFDSVAYFTDGGRLGMRPGDVVMIKSHGTTVATSWYLRLACVSHITTAGVAFLSTQSLITCTT